MKQLSTRIALATGIVCSLAAVTAFGVAPLSAPPLPPMAIVLDPVAIEPQVLQVEPAFPQSESIRRGETLGSLMARLGTDDPEFAAFVRRDPIARRLLQLQSGRTVTATL
ncbi:MAG TPA: M23 family peptidase, partial [Burkholderiaceae bacterium]|nr:M23 family peptidase [Burkholderiaceae bacterium]